jgi:hypothetical protein
MKKMQQRFHWAGKDPSTIPPKLPQINRSAISNPSTMVPIYVQAGQGADPGTIFQSYGR